MKAIITKYTCLLLAGHLLSWWIFFFSPFDIPEKIPMTPVKIDGIVTVGLLLTIIITAQKKTLKFYPETSTTKLTLVGTIICFSSELIFQTLRQSTLMHLPSNDRMYHFLLGVIGITCFCVAFSFMSAFQLKTKKTEKLVLMIIGLIVLTNIIGYFFPAIGGQ